MINIKNVGDAKVTYYVLSNHIFFAFLSVMVAKGSTSTHFVKKSVATNRNFLCAKAIWKGPNMSNPHWVNMSG